MNKKKDVASMKDIKRKKRKRKELKERKIELKQILLNSDKSMKLKRIYQKESFKSEAQNSYYNQIDANLRQDPHRKDHHPRC